MKTKIILSAILMLFISSMKAQINSVQFGTQLEQEIEITTLNPLVSKVTLLELDKKYSKEFYNNNKTDDSHWKDPRDVTVISVTGNKYKVIIPPLKPNAFYRIRYEYLGNDNLYAVMKMLHDEGNAGWETTDKNWMKAFRFVSNKYDPYLLTYRTTKADVKKYARLITDINLNGEIAEATKAAVVEKTKEAFPNLKINNAVVVPDRAVAYAKFVKGLNLDSITENDLDTFEQTVGPFYDYSGFYDLYLKYFKSYFENNPFISTNYIEYFNKAIAEEKRLYTGTEMLPNIILIIESQINVGYKTFSTFASSFQTAYERALVPDFGYVVFVGDNKDFEGGSPFVGVNISLAPVNKNVPMRISYLSIWQRLSVHTGIATNKIAASKKREDLFKDNSLLLGFGYKVLNHNFRINFGGILYKSIDPISGSKSFAVQPYVGVSIDFEIRKWLSQTVSALKL